MRVAPWDGLRDSIDILAEVVESAPSGAVASLRSVIARMQGATLHARNNLDDTYPTLRALCEETASELDRELLAFVATGAHRHEADLLHAIRTSVERLHKQLQQMRRELDALVPWLGLRGEAAAHGLALPTAPRLDDIAAVSRRLRSELEAKEDQRRREGAASPELDASAQRLDEALRAAEANAEALASELMALAELADEEVRRMDFKLLYDRERRLFHIGYNATSDQVDPNYYDLLASEARLASYVAIVKRDVPQSHWYALGRPLTQVAGSAALLSWGGTMFEYLMPGLLMRSQPGTLLARTSALAVDAQIAHAKQRREPWGVSESAYGRLDAAQTYQYRSFGVPGLGFKRGLEEDRVVTPYASLLALSIRPRAVVRNVEALEAVGMLGTYGLFEALDAAPERLSIHPPHGQPFVVVRSYMAHHQGMLLIALGNFLNGRNMVDRFHSDALVETGEVLLNEHAPDDAPSEWPITDAPKVPTAAEPAVTAPRPVAVRRDGRSAGVRAQQRSHDELADGLGGGGLRWQGLALTRYEPDATRDDEGGVFYVRDEETRRIWLATSLQGRTTFAMHKAEFHHRNEGISMHVDVAVAAADDVEVRQITLHNETNRPRRLTLTSAARPVLFDATRAPTHPAFSSMFIESEAIAEIDALLFARRPQTLEEKPAVLVHRLVREGSVSFAGYETDRCAFFGRNGSADAPAALTKEGEGLHGRVGAVLDPIMSLMARVELKAKGSVTLAFVTSVGRSRAAAIELARKYGSMHAVRWTFRDAEDESPRRLVRTKLEPALVPSVQRLFSAMLFADPTLRALPAARTVAPPCQRRLWGRGISGDDPIVLVRVNDPDAPLLAETIAAHASCARAACASISFCSTSNRPATSPRARGCCAPCWSRTRSTSGSDATEASTCSPSIKSRRARSATWRRARASSWTRGTPRSRRVCDRVVESPPKLPRFEATLESDAGDQPRPRPKLLFDNGTGGFTEDGREYVLEVTPGEPTPAPWCNVLANAELGCLVSESSLGTTWSLNSGENRLTPWRNDPVSDPPSEALYLRDEETAAVWSPTPLPAGQSGPTLVRHGAGYTTYERESHGLVQELTVFVPHDAAIKVVRLRVKNTLPRHRRLTATYYAEWVLGSRREGQRPFIVSEVDRERACLLATCDWNQEFGGRVAFLASKDEMHGFTADRTEFLGRRGDYARPEALERWGLSGRVDLGADPCAALQVHMELAAGESRETHFVLGQSQSRDEALALVARFRDGAVVEAAWNGLGAFWDGVLGNIRVKTPEPSMDLHAQSMAPLSEPLFAHLRANGLLSVERRLRLPGSAPRCPRPPPCSPADGTRAHSGGGQTSIRRGRCPALVAPTVGSRRADALLGRPGVAAVRGGGIRPRDGGRCDPRGVGDLSERRAARAGGARSLRGIRAVGEVCPAARTLPQGPRARGDRRGARTSADGGRRLERRHEPHRREGARESVWLAWFLCATMDRFAALATHGDDGAEASQWRARAAALRAKVKDVAWDGAWYLRAFHDDGSLVGSAKSRECRIDSIAQSWAVLSKDASDGAEPRSSAAVRAADDQLVREANRLVLLFWPPFDSTLHDPGYVRAYPPGVRENGGQYTHAATWLGFAHAALGDGARAERIFRLLNPTLRARTAADAARYRVEPYALAGDIYSSAPWVGRGGWTWYTGAAAWMWRLGIEAILGLRKRRGSCASTRAFRRSGRDSKRGFAWVRRASTSSSRIPITWLAVSRR